MHTPVARKERTVKKKSHPPVVRWVMHPSDRGRLVTLDGNWEEEDVPGEDEVIIRPFLVEASSRQPVPVRVVQRLEWHHSAAPTFVLVVRTVEALGKP
jgi:hypothetical protein